MLNRRVPIIADDYVDREFGTGALKITPGHDPADYEIGQRHGLEIINIMNQDATLNANAGPYAGQDREVAREKLWADMKAAGMTIREQPYRHAVPRTQRGGEVVEPMVSKQWFVKIKPLAERAIAAVREGQIKIVPEHFEKVYFNWMENIEDWCISRQLWWGHRIPAWYCDDCGEITVARTDPTQCAHCGSPRSDPGPGRARYVVQQRSVAVQHARLAGRYARPAPLLPDQHHGNGLRHPVLLGGPHDHDGPVVDRRDPVPHGLSARPGPGRASAAR